MKFWIQAFSILLAVQPILADSVTVQPGLGTSLDQYMERLEGYGFSGQLLIVKDGDLVLHKGYGWADREKAIPVTTGTLFEIASISKQFTAAAILKLEMHAKLSISDSVRKFFPDAPSHFQDVTLHHLLTHTAGLEDDYNYYSRHPVVDRNAFVNHILNMQLSEGREMVYSNDGYSLLAAIVEIVSGIPFEEFVSKELFQPAAMENSGFITKPDKILNSLAVGYGGTRSEPGHSWLNVGNTGVVSNVEDLYRWHMALQSDRVLSAKAREKFFRAHVKTDIPFDYGYGWWIEQHPQFGKVIWHSGNSNSFNGVYRWFVDHQMLVILLTNLAIGDFPVREALLPPLQNTPFKSILHCESVELPPAFLPADDVPLIRFAGTYRFQDGSRVEVTAQNEGLHVLPLNQTAFNRFLPVAKTVLSRDRITLLQFTKKTESLLQSLMIEDSTILRELTQDEEGFRAGDPFDVFWKNWKELQKQYGQLIGVKVLGTTIFYRTEKSLRAETITLLTYENGRVYYRWVWNQDHISTALPGLPLPVIPEFRNQSSNSFANHHLFLHASTFLEFALRDGEPEALIIGGERAEKIHSEFPSAFPFTGRLQ